MTFLVQLLFMFAVVQIIKEVLFALNVTVKVFSNFLLTELLL